MRTTGSLTPVPPSFQDVFQDVPVAADSVRPVAVEPQRSSASAGTDLQELDLISRPVVDRGPFTSAGDEAFQAMRRQVAACYGLQPLADGPSYRVMETVDGESGTVSDAMQEYLNQRVFEMHGQHVDAAALPEREARMQVLDSYATAAKGMVHLAPLALAGTVAAFFQQGLARVIGPGASLAVAGVAVGTFGTALEPVVACSGADILYRNLARVDPLHPAVLDHYRKTCPRELLQLLMTGMGLTGGMTLKNGFLAWARASLAGAGLPTDRIDTAARVLDGVFTLLLGGAGSEVITDAMVNRRISTLGIFLGRPDYLKHLAMLDREAPADTWAGLQQRSGRLAGALREIGGSLGAGPTEIMANLVSLNTLAKLLWVAGLFTAQGLLTPLAQKHLTAYPPAVQQLVAQIVAALANLPFFLGFPLVGKAPGMAVDAVRRSRRRTAAEPARETGEPGAATRGQPRPLPAGAVRTTRF